MQCGELHNGKQKCVNSAHIAQKVTSFALRPSVCFQSKVTTDMLLSEHFGIAVLVLYSMLGSLIRFLRPCWLSFNGAP